MAAGILLVLIILDVLKAMKNAKHLRANGTKKGHYVDTASYSIDITASAKLCFIMLGTGTTSNANLSEESSPSRRVKT